MADKKFDLVFVDVETTGLNPEEDEIIELAAIRVDPWTMAEKSRFHRLFMPSFEPSDEVKKINGFDRAKWVESEAVEWTEKDLQDLCPLLEGAAFAGQNPAFDRSFIQAAFEFVGPVPMPPMDYHLVDVASLAWPLFIAGLIPGMSLKHTRKYFGLEGEQKHRALADVEDTIAVYVKLMELWKK